MSEIVLAISGSMRKPSFTERMLDLCLEGMGSGLEVHKFYPHDMNIGYCTGCWACWGKKSPGQCVQKDDFEKILEIYKKADYFLLAAPLYVFGFPASVKNVIDRFFVTIEPAQVSSPHGGTEHPKRYDIHPRAVLVSSCGFPEIENFDLMVRHFGTLCDHMDWIRAGELLISAAGVHNAPILFDEKYEFLKRAGAELRSGRISKSTADQIAAPVIDAEDYRRMATLSFEGGSGSRAQIEEIVMKAIVERK